MACNADRLPCTGLRLLSGNVTGGGPGTNVPAESAAVFYFRYSGHDAALLAQPRLTNKRHGSPTTGPAAGNGTHPDVGYRICPSGEHLLIAAPEEFALSRDFLGCRHLNGRVQVANLLPHAFKHDATPVFELARQMRSERLRINQRT